MRTGNSEISSRARSRARGVLRQQKRFLVDVTVVEVVEILAEKEGISWVGMAEKLMRTHPDAQAGFVELERRRARARREAEAQARKVTA
jgi:hypothetical protein